MSIAREELKHIALLSRLELTEAEADLYTHHIGDILNYVEKLKTLDVRDVEPTSHAVPVFNIMRKDVVQPSLTTQEALSNAPDKDFPYFRVPRVTE